MVFFQSSKTNIPEGHNDKYIWKSNIQNIQTTDRNTLSFESPYLKRQHTTEILSAQLSVKHLR